MTFIDNKSNMRKLLTLIGVIAMASSVFAQSDSSAVNTVNFDDDDPSRDRIIMNVHWDGWLTRMKLIVHLILYYYLSGIIISILLISFLPLTVV